MKKFALVALIAAFTCASFAQNGIIRAGSSKSGARIKRTVRRGGMQPGEALGRQFIRLMKTGDAKRVAALYAPDAYIISPVAEKHGRAEILKDFEGLFSMYKVTDMTMKTHHYVTVGNICYGNGTVSMTIEPKGGGKSETEILRFSDVSRKFGNRWLYVVDHASARAPMQPPSGDTAK